MAFARQQWLPKRATLLRYTYIVCPVSYSSQFLEYIPELLSNSYVSFPTFFQEN